jgi:hypothetical protein
MTIKEKEMKISQTYRADSVLQAPKLALRGLMHRLGLAFLACTLVIGATGSASASEARNEAAVRALGDSFAKAFLQKNAKVRASLFAEDGTFVTPQGDFARAGRDGEGLWSRGAASRQRQHASGVFQLPGPLHQTRCRGRRRAPHRAQCQRSRGDDYPRDTDQLFLRGRPSRRSLADRGWARAFRARAA